MFRNELVVFMCLVVSLFIYEGVKVFHFSLSGIGNMPDWTARLNPNDSLINSFNFFWTSFTYLPAFFFTCLHITLTLYSIRTGGYCIWVCLLLLIAYSIEMFDFIGLNYHWEIRDKNLTSINLLLTNNLNKYHPFIFYFSVFLLAPSILWLSNLHRSTNLFLGSFSLFLTSGVVIKVVCWNSFALFLGSWWAVQEGTWGGWWNWDASEVLGLLVSLIGVQVFHTRSRWDSVMSLLERSLHLTGAFIFSYFFIQLNFDLVSHNFGSKFFFFFNNNLFFLEVLGICIIVGLAHSLVIYKVRNQSFVMLGQSLDTIGATFNWLGFCVLYASITVVLFSSFLPLLNYFIWNYLGINTFNAHFDIRLFVIVVFLLILITFSTLRMSQTSFLVCILDFGGSSLINLILSLTQVRLTTSSLIHIFLLTLIALNVSSYSLNFVQWLPSMIHEEVLIASKIVYLKHSFFSCDMFFVDKINTHQSGHSSLNFGSWNTFYRTNSFNLNSFVLRYDAEVCYNYYLLSEDFCNAALYIETNYLNNLIETWYTMLLPLVGLYFTSCYRVSY